MGCDEPLKGYFSKVVNPTGKRSLVFDPRLSLSGVPVPVPCQQCMGCRLEHSRMWAVRAMHEKQMHPADGSMFLTLTYDNKNLPAGGTLVRRDVQLFTKRYRDVYGSKLRIYGCGEYGESFGRPHYHLIFFNSDAPDRKYYKTTDAGDKLFTSNAVAKLWPVGFNVIGDVTFKSCAYVARYVTTKLTGKRKAEYDAKGLLPPFPIHPRNPGLGAGWFEKFGAHAYEWDSVVMNGKEMRPPRFYDTRYEVLDSDRLALLKLARRSKFLLNKADNTRARRRVKEDVLRHDLKQREF